MFAVTAATSGFFALLSAIENTVPLVQPDVPHFHSDKVTKLYVEFAVGEAVQVRVVESEPSAHPNEEPERAI